MKFLKFAPAFAIAFALQTGASSATTIIDLSVRGFGGSGCGPGQAETRTYELTGGFRPTPGVPFQPTAEIPLEVNYGDGDCAARARVYGMSGVIGLDGIVANSDSRNQSANVSAFGELRSTDIFVTPAAGNTYASLLGTFGPNIAVRANLNFAGDIFANNGGSSAFLGAFVSLTGQDNLGVNQTDFDRADIGTGLTPINGAVPITTNPLVTETILVDPRRPLSLIFQLRGTANARPNTDLVGDAQFNSYSSLSFNPDGPAFFVPEGFTVNAPSLGIFDNQWIDPRVAAPVPSPVPLPAGGLLLLSGLLAFLRFPGHRRDA